MKKTVTIAVFLAVGSLAGCSQNRGSREIASDSRRESVAPPDRRQPVPVPPPPTQPPKPTSSTPAQPAKPTVPAASTEGPANRPAAPAAANRPIDRVVATNTAAGATTAAMRYAIELLAPEGGEGRRVPLDHVFRSGDRIRLQLASVEAGYVTVLQVGSSGSSSLLYPDPARGMTDHFLSPGMRRSVPPEGAWFRFDQKPGEERLLVIVSNEQRAGQNLGIAAEMTAEATGVIVAQADRASKDLRLETVSDAAGENWTHVEGKPGQPLVFSISLRHE